MSRGDLANARRTRSALKPEEIGEIASWAASRVPVRADQVEGSLGVGDEPQVLIVAELAVATHQLALPPGCDVVKARIGQTGAHAREIEVERVGVRAADDQ